MKTAIIKRNEIKICLPEIDESLLIQQLFNDILADSFQVFPSPAIEAYKKNWTKQKITERIKNRHDLLLIAWDDKKPVGLVSGTPPEGGVGTIIWLLVAAEYQNKKIGSNLLHRACDYYRNTGCHKLKLTAPSEQAKNFYIKYGMSPEGFHPKHWWNVDFWALGMQLE